MIQIISRLQSISHSPGSDLTDVRRELERGARLEGRGETLAVSFVVTFRTLNERYGRKGRLQHASVTLFGNGYSPGIVLEAAEEAGSLSSLLHAYAEAKPGVSGAGAIEHVEMLLFPAASRGK